MSLQPSLASQWSPMLSLRPFYSPWKILHQPSLVKTDKDTGWVSLACLFDLWLQLYNHLHCKSAVPVLIYHSSQTGGDIWTKRFLRFFLKDLDANIYHYVPWYRPTPNTCIPHTKKHNTLSNMSVHKQNRSYCFYTALHYHLIMHPLLVSRELMSCDIQRETDWIFADVGAISV